jgi:hypothetical protein
MTMMMQMDDASEKCFALSLPVPVLVLVLAPALLSACLDLGKTPQGRELELEPVLVLCYERVRETAQEAGNPA